MPVAKESGGNFTPAPEGTHLARCFAVIALGTQKANNPQFTDSFKVMICWELPDEKYVVDGKEAPMTVSKEYTLSLSKKAILRGHLESWRGRQFTEEELKGFDVAKVIGQPCLLNIAHKVSGGGKTYAAIQSVAKPMKNTECPKQFHTSVAYEVEQGRNEVFKALPEWIAKKIEACEEWIHPPIDREEAPTTEEEPDEEKVPF